MRHSAAKGLIARTIVTTTATNGAMAEAVEVGVEDVGDAAGVAGVATRGWWTNAFSASYDFTGD